MAIIYTYPGQSIITGKELVLISDDDNQKSTRNITLQQIANLNGTNPGVSSVYFEDSLGLSPSATETAQNPDVATGVVEVTGTVLAIGGGTGKDSAALTAANVGDILAVNANNDGYDFVAPPTGETYTFSTEQNTTVPANVDLFIENSQNVKDVVTLVPGSTNVTLTANNTVDPPTITIDATGGQGQTYTGGNGIAISNANVISADLANGGGLGFDNAQLTTNLTPSNLATSTLTNGNVLTYTGSSMSWLQPAYKPQITTHNDWSLVYVDGSYNIALHTGITNPKGYIVVHRNGASDGQSLISFKISFQLPTGPSSTLTQASYHLGLALPGGEPIFPNYLGEQEFAGSMSRVNVIAANGTIYTDQWQNPITNVAILQKSAQVCDWESAQGFRDGATCANNYELQQFIWFSTIDQKNDPTPEQTIYQPTTGWIKNNVDSGDTIYMAGSITAYGNLTP